MITALIVEVIMVGRYMVNKLIDIDEAIKLIRDEIFDPECDLDQGYVDGLNMAISILSNEVLLPIDNSWIFKITSPSKDKYEYHYDHTDCIYYSSEERHTCPSTCAQYRDGWNDAMQYIFKGGDGYRPYRRNKKYE